MSFIGKALQWLKGKQSSSAAFGQMGGVSVYTFSSLDADRVAGEMSEMYFQCPRCGTYEQVNNIGKMMLACDPNSFTSIECIKCKHGYNARARLRKGECPGFDYESN